MLNKIKKFKLQILWFSITVRMHHKCGSIGIDAIDNISFSNNINNSQNTIYQKINSLHFYVYP